MYNDTLVDVSNLNKFECSCFNGAVLDTFSDFSNRKLNELERRCIDNDILGNFTAIINWKLYQLKSRSTDGHFDTIKSGVVIHTTSSCDLDHFKSGSVTKQCDRTKRELFVYTSGSRQPIKSKHLLVVTFKPRSSELRIPERQFHNIILEPHLE